MRDSVTIDPLNETQRGDPSASPYAFELCIVVTGKLTPYYMRSISLNTLNTKLPRWAENGQVSEILIVLDWPVTSACPKRLPRDTWNRAYELLPLAVEKALLNNKVYDAVDAACWLGSRNKEDLCKSIASRILSYIGAQEETQEGVKRCAPVLRVKPKYGVGVPPEITSLAKGKVEAFCLKNNLQVADILFPKNNLCECELPPESDLPKPRTPRINAMDPVVRRRRRIRN